MEVKINREIRNYTESIYFGLSLRQFLFSVMACIMATGLYFLLGSIVNKEVLSWLCMLSASPFIALGFLKYNGMTAGQFIWVWIKSEILVPKTFKFQNENYYYEILKPRILENQRKEISK